MNDVMKIAMERRIKLQEEISKLEDFIRMADTLMQGNGPRPQAAMSVPEPVKTEAVAPEADDAADESPMRAAARRLSDSDRGRSPEPEQATGTDVPRPSIIRRGLAS